MSRFSLFVVGAAACVLLACGEASDDAEPTPVIDPGDGGQYSPDIDPSRFVEEIDNPYLPLRPGSRWVYESADGSERIEVVVLDETREVMGIRATVVRDTVTEDGELVEDTYDWYAQDVDGNVWYLGEETVEYVDGEPDSTAGSWEAGVGGALPGLLMAAHPAVGLAYRQEYWAGEAEDLAEIVEVDGAEQVAFGSFSGLVVIREWTPLDPEAVELKYYAPGIGPVLEVKVAGGDDRLELVAFE